MDCIRGTTCISPPIRRYADLVVHRNAGQWIRGEKRSRIDFSKLDQLGKHLSRTERNSVEAERESVRDKLFFYQRELGKHPPTIHSAIITEINRKDFSLNFLKLWSVL